MGYMDRNQSLEKERRMKLVHDYFKKHGGTIPEISKATGISKSSVQRYLNEGYTVDELKRVKDYLQSNKEEGRSRGGKNSGYSKDELGRFTGSGKGRCK